MTNTPQAKASQKMAFEIRECQLLIEGKKEVLKLRLKGEVSDAGGTWILVMIEGRAMELYREILLQLDQSRQVIAEVFWDSENGVHCKAIRFLRQPPRT